MNVDGYGERVDVGRIDGYDVGWWCFKDWEPFIFVWMNWRGMGGWDGFLFVIEREDWAKVMFGW